MAVARKLDGYLQKFLNIFLLAVDYFELVFSQANLINQPFLAATKKPISSAELGRQLGIATQTAWTMRRKIMHAMTRREGELMLAGLVEMDESYMGGVNKGFGAAASRAKPQWR